MSNEWRRVAAALARDDRRRAYAAVVLRADSGLPPVKLARALADLRAVGLVDDSGATSVFSDLLAASAPVTRTGIERWMRDGRIEQYPAKPSDRRELYEWVAARLPAGVLTEAEVNELLEALVDDYASLRRYLVDEGLLRRSADGASYERF